MAKIKTVIKLQIDAGKASPAPPIGPALAPHGINISDFTTKFNDQSKDQMGSKLPVEITIFEDATFKFKIKQPLASELIKKALGIEKGSGTPNKKKIAKITREQLKEIAKKKLPDLNTNDLDVAAKIIEGTAKNMGVEIVS